MHVCIRGILDRSKSHAIGLGAGWLDMATQAVADIDGAILAHEVVSAQDIPILLQFGAGTKVLSLHEDLSSVLGVVTGVTERSDRTARPWLSREIARL